MKEIIQNSLPSSMLGQAQVIVGRTQLAAKKLYNDYSPFIKRSLGLFRFPLLAAAAVGTYYHSALMIPASILAYSVYRNLSTEYQRRHLWTAEQFKSRAYDWGKSIGLGLGVGAATLYLSRKNR